MLSPDEDPKLSSVTFNATIAMNVPVHLCGCEVTIMSLVVSVKWLLLLLLVCTDPDPPASKLRSMLAGLPGRQ